MGYIDVSAEAVTFLLSLALGAVLCVLYDVVRVLHCVSVRGFFEVLVTDILFWIFAAFLTFCFLILRCQGTVRGYVIFGAALGFFIVRITISKYFMIGVTAVLRFLRKIYGAFSGMLRRMLAPVSKMLKKIQIVLKKVLKDRIKLLYNQIKYSGGKIKEDEESGGTN